MVISLLVRSLTRGMRPTNITQVMPQMIDCAGFLRTKGGPIRVFELVALRLSSVLPVESRPRVQWVSGLLEKFVLNLQTLLIGFDRTYGIDNRFLPNFHSELA